MLDLGALNNGNNAVTLDSNTMGSLRVVTGTGNDTLTLSGGSIQSAIFVNLGAGNDTLNMRNGSTPINGSTVPVLPSPLLGAIDIDGGAGIDTFHYDAGLVLPPDVNNFEVFVSP